MSHPFPAAHKDARQFRVDINGLRAWAVAAVILYHFGVPGFAGGFVGVDLFFVISGFLMTGIVLRGLERGNFSLFDFYMARARRIIPALAVLCLALVALGWFVLLPPDYRQLGAHAGYSLGFLSNFAYFLEAGYFDTASQEKWLLHTWSLSVEWQFYMLLPVVMWAAWRIKPGRTVQLWLLLAGCAVSLAASIIVTKSDPGAAFFLLHTRAWEMLAGGLVFLLGQRITLSEAARGWMERAGLLLIVLAVAVLDKHAAWPGYLALLPVLAAMLVILANRASFLTSNRAAQWLGDRSYSLYLWHWPICVGLVYAEMETMPMAIAGGMLATLLLGHLSYITVERHAKTILGGARMREVMIVTAGILLAAGPALYAWRAGGVPGRFPANVELAAAESSNVNPRRADCHPATGTVSPACRFGAPAPGTRALLVGDSHASVLVSAMSEAARRAGADVTLLSYSGCPYLPGMKMHPAYLARLPATYQCTAFNDWVRSRIAATPASVPLVIASRYAGAALGTNGRHDRAPAPVAYFSTPQASATPALLREFAARIVDTACEAAAGGRPVYLVRPVPEMGRHVPRSASRRMSLGLDGEVSIGLDDYRARNAWVWQAQDDAVRRCGVKVLNPTASLCRGGRCYGTLGARPVYFDDNHLSEYGNTLLAPLFAPVFGAR
ncbi:acyltransferase [Massilia sp. PAMC28688]|uniref:acyltransferase family protein n=1 Tax=Massilia sp. PAMC28688 TaxID=2861283 RepID=UPI001C62FD8E|nr:acyltransferase family protein [Massilia sp. PAMC28688]QYF94279.1 acyltransferase [Massilia sp. PAMC28688]